MGTERRAFIAGLASSLTILSLSAVENPLGAEPLADDWLTSIAGKKQKAFLDIGRYFVDGTPFRRAGNLLMTLHGAFGVAEDQIGVAFGAHSSGLGHVMSQSAWDEFKLADLIAPALLPGDVTTLNMAGKRWGMEGAEGCAALQARGVRLLACNGSMTRWSQKLAAARNENADAVLKQLAASLHPGVEIVPAMIAAAVMAQGKGIGYVSLA